MPCFCLEPYDNGTRLVMFRCGHVCHSDCANQHLANRFQNRMPPSCPVCNSLFRRRYRIFLNIGEEDVEQFLLTNPRIFANLVERNQHILNEHQQQRQQSQQQQEQQQQQNQEDQHNEENGNNANRHGNSDDEDSEDILAIPHLGLCMRVDQHGISFRPLRQ